MSSINKAILIGNLGADPEIAVFENGERICRISLATNSSWKDKENGEWREKTQWHKVVVRDEYLVDLASRRLTKGAKVYVEGAIETRSWSDADGQTQQVVEIILRKFRGALTVLNQGTGRVQSISCDTEKTQPSSNDWDGDIPF